MTRIYITLVLCLIFSPPAMPQQIAMKVNLRNGDSVTFDVDEITKITFNLATIVEHRDLNYALRAFKLFQNYPNPFNPTTTIQYEISKAGKVQITIFNLKGQLIRDFEQNVSTPGIHQIVWDSKNNQGGAVSSGFYVYQIRQNNQITSKKMVLIK